MGTQAAVSPARRSVRLCAAAIDLATTPLMRRLSLTLLWLALLFRRLLPIALLGRATLAVVRMEAACCRQGSPLHRLLERYLDRLERAGAFERMRRFVTEAPRWRVALRLDAWLRIGLFSLLRHQILSAHLGSPTVPPRLLTHVQLALSARCDLSCEGCYSAGDRDGRAPHRDEIAFFVDEAAACGAFIVHVVGKGEPFLSSKWAGELLDVIEARPHILFTVASHGMRIDEPLARRMGNLGNLLLLVAVDGPEAIHDARRGAGSYARVQEVLSLLRAHGVLFGFSCMVSAKSHRALTRPELVRAQADAGCAVAVYSRYFPLASSEVGGLVLSATDSRAYAKALEEVQSVAPIPVIDLDEMESHTGCNARAGEAVYLDGISGQVTPCLRVPFAPAACRIDRALGMHLANVLGHAFFVDYRSHGQGCPSWCGADLGGELASMEQLLADHANASEQLTGYRRRLPLASASPPPPPPRFPLASP